MQKYQLDGRATVHEDGTDYDIRPAPCIFCGKTATHVNDGGNAWTCTAVVRVSDLAGSSIVARMYLYHMDCAVDAVWRCGCVADYVECVGAFCGACRKPRTEAEPYPGTCDRCRGGAMLSDRVTIHETVECECLPPLLLPSPLPARRRLTY